MFFLKNCPFPTAGVGKPPPFGSPDLRQSPVNESMMVQQTSCALLAMVLLAGASQARPSNPPATTHPPNCNGISPRLTIAAP
jgi:hypothetical protein